MARVGLHPHLAGTRQPVQELCGEVRWHDTVAADVHHERERTDPRQRRPYVVAKRDADVVPGAGPVPVKQIQRIPVPCPSLRQRIHLGAIGCVARRTK